MATFTKIITIAVFLQPLALAATCDGSAASCKQEQEETSLLQTKAAVQHGTALKDTNECWKQNADDTGGKNLCFCKLGFDCVTGLGFAEGLATVDDAKCIWSPPGVETFRPGEARLHHKVFKQADGNFSGTADPGKKENKDWGLWYFNSVACPQCKCHDTYKPERDLPKSASADQQVASLANLIYQDVGCPEPGEAPARFDKWKTASGWELAIGQKGQPICKNTRDNDKQGWLQGFNSSEYNSAAHDNFALFINENGAGEIQKKQCVLSIEGTTFNGIKNWMDDATPISQPWCGMNVQAGFKAEIMQFLGNWASQENEKLVDKSYQWYSRAAFEADRDAPTEPLVDIFTQFVKNDCSDLWVTGHSLGGAMAELFAMCWNKPFNDVDGATQDVSKVYTFGAPSAFDPWRIPQSTIKSSYGEKTEWTTCFGGKRFFNMNSDAAGEFDPVPVIATDLGWMHLPYDAVQLGTVSVQTTDCSAIPDSRFKGAAQCTNNPDLSIRHGCKTKCTDVKDKECASEMGGLFGVGKPCCAVNPDFGQDKGVDDDAVPKDCPVCQLPLVPNSGSWASKIPGAKAATYITSGGIYGGALHSMSVYEERLKPDSATQRGR